MLTKIKKFLQTNKCTLLLAVSLFLFAFDAEAEVFGALKAAGGNIANGLFYIIPRAAMIGIACICIGGMFGNFNWKWLAAIAIGLFVIGMYTAVQGYITGSYSAESNSGINGSN